MVDLQPTSTLTATLVGGTPISYTWDLGDSSPRTTTTVPTLTYEYATFGTYTVTVTVAFTTTRSSEVLTLTSQTLVDIPGIEIVADDVFFVEQPITLTSNLFNLTPISYTWDFGDGEGIIGSGEGITATNIVTHTYQNIGVYTVTVQAVTEQGEVSAQVQVNVIEQPLTSLTAANSSPSEALQATVFTATVTGARPSTVVSYTWDFGDYSQPLVIGAPPGTVPVTYTYSTPGIYTATVIAGNGFMTLSQTTRVTVTDVAIVGCLQPTTAPVSWAK
ncbi:MAG: PKD domain-containing protein [Chloroflexaceae bacterium]|nr:PKD domain-containing protein [Chloroflexaceae bacterium]